MNEKLHQESGNNLYKLQTTPTEAKKSPIENRQREEWLKFKGMDTFEAMKLYIEKVKQLAEIYPVQEDDIGQDEQTDGSKEGSDK